MSVALITILLCCSLPWLLFWPLCWLQDWNIPSHTEVIISACKDESAIGVPQGDVLFVREGHTGKTYMLDLRTGEKKRVPDDPFLRDYRVFLSSKLAWLVGSFSPPTSPSYQPNYILDLMDGKRYELLNLELLPRLNGGKFNPENYTYIQSAEQIYLDHSENALIALTSDFRTNPKGRVIFSGYSIGTEHGKGLEELLREWGKNYEIIDLSTTLYAGLPSPTGKYVVKNDGIYLSGTNTSIVTREYTGARFMGGYFKGWYYDESGVVVQGGGYYLITLPGTASYYYIPSPVLKLQLPAP